MNTSAKIASALIVFVIILVLAAILMAVPAPVRNPQATTTPSTGSTSQAFTSENVTVSSPLPNAVVGKAFTVSGSAKGTWYFEASFPVQVRDKDNNKVGQGIAQAEGDWMTPDFVPFTAHVTVENYSGPATLVFLKDNPSGLPENDNSVEFPIVVQ